MKVSLVQMTSGRDVDRNLSEAHRWIQQAAKTGTRLVVLPEMFACLGVSNQHQLAGDRFHDQDVLATLGGWAKQFNIYLLAGSVPMRCEPSADKKVYAASLMFSPDGNLISQYNKIHLFDVDVGDEKGSYRESDTFIPGDKPQAVLVDGLKLGMSICYDLRFPELYQRYMSEGCSIIAVPSAFTYQTGRLHWETLLRARAIETQSFILAANQGGEHEDGRQTWGHSMIVAPNGSILAELSSQDSGIVSADLDLSLREGIQSAMPLSKHKRLM